MLPEKITDASALFVPRKCSHLRGEPIAAAVSPVQSQVKSPDEQNALALQGFVQFR